jgi:hypothetical protein
VVSSCKVLNDKKTPESWGNNKKQKDLICTNVTIVAFSLFSAFALENACVASINILHNLLLLCFIPFFSRFTFTRSIMLLILSLSLPSFPPLYLFLTPPSR